MQLGICCGPLEPYKDQKMIVQCKKMKLFADAVVYIDIIEASNPVPTPLLGHRCRSSQEITGSPTPFSTSNHYL